MNDDIPEEDKLLAGTFAGKPVYGQCAKHEWVDLYGGGGFKRGNPQIAIATFYCKWCLKTRLITYDQSMVNLEWNPEEHGDYRDG